MDDNLNFPNNGNNDKKLPATNNANNGMIRKTGAEDFDVKEFGPTIAKEEEMPVDYSTIDYKVDFGDQDTEKSGLSTATKPFNAGMLKPDPEEVEEASSKKPKKKSKLKKIILWICMGLVGLLIGAGIFVGIYVNRTLNKITYIAPDSSPTFVNDEGEVINIEEIRESIAPEIPVIDDEDITNFLLIGIDSRYKTLNEKGGLADVIMIMSIDNNAGTIKLVSIARDSYAYVPGYNNPMKINAAMTKGGPELLQLTVESTLRIPIDGYAFVNFYNMAGVIDAVGGVYCNVTSAELYSEAGLNDNLAEINGIYGYAPDFQQVTSTGDIWLNGRQAVAYARIRHIDSDYARSERQVEVLRSIMSQFSQMSTTGKASCIDDILGLVATNISKTDILSYAFDFLPSMKNMEIQYFQLPLEGYFNSGMYGDEWSIRNNWNMTIPVVQQFLYGETKDFDPVADIPSSPSNEKCPTDFDIEGHISR